MTTYEKLFDGFEFIDFLKVIKENHLEDFLSVIPDEGETHPVRLIDDARNMYEKYTLELDHGSKSLPRIELEKLGSAVVFTCVPFSSPEEFKKRGCELSYSRTFSKKGVSIGKVHKIVPVKSEDEIGTCGDDRIFIYRGNSNFEILERMKRYGIENYRNEFNNLLRFKDFYNALHTTFISPSKRDEHLHSCIVLIQQSHDKEVVYLTTLLDMTYYRGCRNELGFYDEGTKMDLSHLFDVIEIPHLSGHNSSYIKLSESKFLKSEKE